MKPYTITTTKWFPFIVKQMIYRAEQTKINKGSRHQVIMKAWGNTLKTTRSTSHNYTIQLGLKGQK